MMKKKIYRPLAALVAVAPLIGVVPQTAEGALLTYSFSFDVSGPESVGNPYSGTFSFDDSIDLNPTDIFAYSLTAFDFLFAGNLFTLASDPGAQALYGWDMQFIGISYSGTSGGNLITFAPGNGGLAPFIPSDPSIASFTYDIGSNGIDGTSSGNLIFNAQPATAPEPQTIALPLLSGLLGFTLLRRRGRTDEDCS